MPESPTRAAFRQRILEVVEQDERVVGLLTSGSASQGRVDEWSDLDIFLYIRDEEMDMFVSQWPQWIAGLGQMLLAYHPEDQPVIAWTIFHAEPVPVRIDFRLIPASQYDSIREWTTRPLSVESLVWYDREGHLTEAARSLLANSLRLPSEEEAQAFTQHYGRMWYFLHSAYCKLQRGHHWYARVSFHMTVLDSPMALLKLEAGAVDRWKDAFPEWNIEHMISPERLAQLNACIPPPDAKGFKQALVITAQLGIEVCESIASQHSWTWPRQAAEEVLQMLSS